MIDCRHPRMPDQARSDGLSKCFMELVPSIGLSFTAAIWGLYICLEVCLMPDNAASDVQVLQSFGMHGSAP